MKRGRARRKSDLRRVYRVREPRGCVLIVCEGEKTEPIYFHSLRRELQLSSLEVDVLPHGEVTDPLSIVQRAHDAIRQRLQSKSPVKDVFEIAYCICDVECPPRGRLGQARGFIQGKQIQLILSNPCFEFWYILHYEKTGRPFQSAQEAKNYLRQHFPDYHESNEQIVDDIREHREIATQRAREIIAERGWGEWLRDCNPATHVFRVVAHLAEMARR